MRHSYVAQPAAAAGGGLVLLRAVQVLIRPVVFSLSRITAALEKVELLWQQAFSKARFQLQRFQLWEEALQVSRRTRV